MDATFAEQIRKDADLVSAIARNSLGAGVGYDEAGVRWLDGFVRRRHEAGDPAIRDALAVRLAAFLGECVVRTYGGDRAADGEGNRYVRFDDRNGVFPFAKARKQPEHGAEDFRCGMTVSGRDGTRDSLSSHRWLPVESGPTTPGTTNRAVRPLSVRSDPPDPRRRRRRPARQGVTDADPGRAVRPAPQRRAGAAARC